MEKKIYRSLQEQGKIFGIEATDWVVASMLFGTLIMIAPIFGGIPLLITLGIPAAFLLALKFVKKDKPAMYLESFFLYIKIRQRLRRKEF